MNPFKTPLTLLLSISSALAQADDPFREIVRSSEPRSPGEERESFQLPEGFEIQLVASEPDLRKPMNMQWDSLGRLWITESREYPQALKDGSTGRDSVRVFSDFAPDGRARKMEIFAEGLNIPTGLYPFRSNNARGQLTWKCVVWSIPNIWLLEDTDGDGKADKREVLFGPLGWERDTHGNLSSFRRGLDGWLYGTHGFNNESTLRGRDGSELHIQSGNTWRVRLDGSRVEGWTFGQVNPFGLCWDERGNLFSADCHSSPIYQLLRGAFYPSFGKPHDGLGFAPQTITHSHGSTAICAPVYVCDTTWPSQWQDHMFVGNVQTSRINHDAIEWHGSSSKGRELPDFLISKDPWFRPVDLSWGPDGALYIADFYNRIIGHYEVPLDHPGRDRERGRLWRVIYNGKKESAPSHPVAGVTSGGIPGLIRELASPNLTRRNLALNELCDVHGSGVLPALSEVLAKPENAFQKLNCLWALHRLGSLKESTLLRAIHDDHPLVRVHALKTAAESIDSNPAHTPPGPSSRTIEAARAALSDSDPFVKRAAVELLASVPASPNIPALLTLMPTLPPADDHLLHTTRIALRNQLRDSAILSSFSLVDLESKNRSPALDALLAVPGETSAQIRLAYLGHDTLSSPELLAAHASSLAKGLAAEKLEALSSLAQRKLHGNINLAGATLNDILSALEQRAIQPDKTLAAWGRQVAADLLALPSPAQRDLQSASQILRTFRIHGLEESLFQAALQPKSEPETCSAAARTLLTLKPDAFTPRIATLLADPAMPARLRNRLANALAETKTSASITLLLGAIRTAPNQVQKSIALALAGYPQGAESLLASCADGKTPAALLRERSLVDRLNALKIPNLEVRIAKLTAGLPPSNAVLEQLIADRRAAFDPAKADAARGAEIFARNCAVCHAIEGKGGLIGPQLDGVGSRGADRLLEDILDPNRNVDRAFRVNVITLKNGSVATGLPRSETDSDLLLSAADASAAETRVAKAEIAERKETETSLMPAAFGEILPPSQLNDLIAFLLKKRP